MSLLMKNSGDSLHILNSAAILWYDSGTMNSFPIHWSKDPISLTSGPLMQKDMQAVDVFI